MQEVKVLDHGFVRLVDIMGSDAAIVDAARVSYGVTDEERDPERDAALIDYLMRHRHTSPFEMAELKFHVKAPIFVARQWLRHRTASVNEVSGRYTVLPDETYLPEAIRVQDPHNKQASDGEHEESAKLVGVIANEIGRARGAYEALLTRKVPREQARIVLPLAQYTEFYWKQDLHNLLHFIELRSAPEAQYEIRQYAEAIASFVRLYFPTTWAAFEEHRLGAVTLSRTEWEAIKKVLDREAYASLIKGVLPKRRYREAIAKLGMTNGSGPAHS